MPPETLSKDAFSKDALEFFTLLGRHEVEYVIVGGEAVIYYGYPRLTGDIDFFYQCSKNNTRRLHACLSEFWQGSIPGDLQADDFMVPGQIIQFGRPPNRIDLLNQIDGVDFHRAWTGKRTVEIVGGRSRISVFYIGLPELLENKRASARAKDKDDLEHLE